MNNTWKGILTGGASALMSRKNKGGGYEFAPYTGYRPPHVENLRPVETDTQNIIRDRAKGVGVGFDPQMMATQQALIQSALQKRQADEIRDASGRIASGGLSGNVRAQEAIAGRVNRDIGRTLGDEIGKLSAAHLTRANDERDTNTARLQRLNEFNFGQENRVADFDLNAYNAEQGFRRDAFGINEGVNQYNQNRSDDQFNDLTGLALAGADIYMTSKGVPPGTTSAAAEALAGKGIAPHGGYVNFASLSNDPLTRSRLRRNIMR